MLPVEEQIKIISKGLIYAYVIAQALAHFVYAVGAFQDGHKQGYLTVLTVGLLQGSAHDPDEIFGKVMSLPDRLIVRYFELTTDIHPVELAEIRKALETGTNPRDMKMRLARELTVLYHGRQSADLAEQRFRAVFQRREIPQDITQFSLPVELLEPEGIDISRLLFAAGLCSSNSEARRLLAQGAVRLNGKKLNSLRLKDLENGDVFQAGKRRFIKISR